jgi:hypothetical protein
MNALLATARCKIVDRHIAATKTRRHERAVGLFEERFAACRRPMKAATRFHDSSVIARTIDWAVEHGIETATFPILTLYCVIRAEQRKVG